MSKELEALNKYIDLCIKLKIGEVKYDEVIDEMRTLYEPIRYALTIPTYYEVCEMFSAVEGVAVRYDAKAQVFINEHGQTLVVVMDNGVLFRCDTLTPRLITMIGRFYESLEEVVE